jgi:predicted RNase H-like HicB family nuclease
MTGAIHLTISYKDAGEGWIMARVAELPGAISQGRTRAEARSNVIDALDVVLTPDELLKGGVPADSDEVLTLTVAS